MSSPAVHPEPEGRAAPAERAADGGGEPPDCIRVELLTPSGTVYRGEALAVSVRAEGGAMEFLPDHGPLMTPLESAVMRVALEGGEAGPFAVHGGFLEVRAGAVRLLADAAEAVAEIDLERARASAERARERLAGGPAGEIDRHRAERSLKRAEVRIGLAGGR